MYVPATGSSLSAVHMYSLWSFKECELCLHWPHNDTVGRNDFSVSFRSVWLWPRAMRTLESTLPSWFFFCSVLSILPLPAPILSPQVSCSAGRWVAGEIGYSQEFLTYLVTTDASVPLHRTQHLQGYSLHLLFTFQA